MGKQDLPIIAWIVDRSAERAAQADAVLSRAGFATVVWSESGPAIVQLRDVPPDLVVVDGLAHECAGAALYQALRQAAALCAIPVLTFEPFALNGNPAVRDSALDVLAAPLSERDLLFRARRQILRRREQVDAAMDAALYSPDGQSTAVRRSAVNQFMEAMIDGFALHKIICDTAGRPIDYRFLYVNSRFEQLTGLRRERIIGRLVSEVFPGGQPDIIERFGSVALGGEPFSIIRYSQELGKHLRIEVYSPKHGQFATIFEDVTDRILKEQALVQAEHEWARTFDAVPDLISVLDLQNRIVRMNKAMADKLKKTGHHCAAQSYFSGSYVNNCSPASCPLVKLFGLPHTGSDGPVEISVPAFGGTFLVTVSPVHGEAGNITGSIHVARDITERRRMELDLEAAKAAAETANQEKSTLIACISHDIRTPLNAVNDIVKLLLASSLSAEQQQMANTILKTGTQMLALLNDTLDLARIEAGKMEIVRGVMEPAACVRDTMDMLRTSADDKGLRLVHELGPEADLPIVGDPVRTRQVLTNLIGNAIKFTREGEVRCAVQIQPAGQGKPAQLLFSVRDTGPGIPPEQLPLLFRRYQQVGSVRRMDGSGLGLFISKSLVELMGGHMWAESAGIPGQGTTISFALPAQAARDSAAPAIRPSTVGPSRSGAVSGAGTNSPASDFARQYPLRILVADDEPYSRMLIEHILTKLGYAPDGCSNGREVLAAARAKEYDLVLLDLVMPVMDGSETARQLRAELPCARRPCIAVLTGYSREDVAEQKLSQDFDVILTKPVSPADLRRVLQAVPPLTGRECTPRGQVCGPDCPTAASTLAEDRCVDLVDLGMFAELRQVIGKDFGLYVERMIDELAAGLAVMRRAIDIGDSPQVQFIAHKLLGSCALSGLRRLCALLKQIELRSARGSIAQAMELVAAAEACLHESRGIMLREAGISPAGPAAEWAEL